MRFADDFVKEYKKFLLHKNATGEPVPNLEDQVADFNNAIKYINSVLNSKSIADLTAEELFDILIQTHLKACPALYQTLPKSNTPDAMGRFAMTCP